MFHSITKLSIALTGFVFCASLSWAASAETLGEKANRICHAYLQHPEEFKPIKNKHTCEIYPYKDAAYSQNSPCFHHQLDGVDQQFAYLSEPGTCSSSKLVTVSGGEHLEASNEEELNVAVNGYGMGKGDKALDYQGVLVATHGDDLRLPTTEGTYILCRFGYQLKAWKPEGVDKSLCEKFSDQKYEVLDQGLESKTIEDVKEHDALFPGDISQGTHVESTAEIDLIGDGKKELFLGVQFAMGAGCGCDIWSAAVTKTETVSESESSEEISSINDAIMRLTDQGEKCNTKRSWSAVSIDGKDYIAENVGEESTAGSSFDYNGFLDRVLYSYKNKKFVEICRARPVTQKLIAHEVKPEVPFLYYKPVNDE